jgi:hypothetical protein
MHRAHIEPIGVNGESGLALYGDDRLISIISVVTDGQRILEVYCVLNPDKLTAVRTSSARA